MEFIFLPYMLLALIRKRSLFKCSISILILVVENQTRLPFKSLGTIILFKEIITFIQNGIRLTKSDSKNVFNSSNFHKNINSTTVFNIVKKCFLSSKLAFYNDF